MAKKRVLKEKIIERKEKKRKVDKQAYWIFGIMIFLVLAVLLIYYIKINANNFEYKNFEFTKEMFGKIPVYRYTYHFEGRTGFMTFNLLLRLDPRENKVPISGDITFPLEKTAYISVNSTGLNECEDGRIALSSLASFISNNQIKVKGASPDPIIANESKVVYATCDNYKDNPVILVQSGDKTEINNKDLCYTIKVNNCEILSAIEKFEVEALLNARKINLGK